MKYKKSTVALQSMLIFFGQWCQASCPAPVSAHTFFRMRPQGVDAAQQLVGWQELLYNNDYSQSGAFAITTAFNHSFNSEQLARYFFKKKSFAITGSRVPSRPPNDLLADYFGLPTDFSSHITCAPKISNFLFDFALFHKINNCGGYIRAHLPLVFTHWDLEFDEKVLNRGTFNHIGGYMSADLLLRENLLPNAHAFFAGNNTSIFGDMRSPLKYGKIGCNKKKSTQLSDVEIEVGHNKFFCNDNHHLGISIRCVIPMSAMPLGDYLFAPMIGNGHHYELGFGISGHTTFYESPCNENSWALYTEAHFMHLLKGPEIRSFDLKNNGILSRYMLLEELVEPQINELFVGTTFDSGGAVINPGILAQVGYNRTLIPAINVLTFTSNVHIALQADIVLKCAYQGDYWGVDFGYNLWTRTKESVHRIGCLQANRWALKGDAQVYGDDGQSVGQLALLPLNATQHCATIYAGQNGGNANKEFLNLNADSAALVGRTDPCTGNKILVFQATGDNLDLGVGGQLIGKEGQVSSSLSPLFISDKDINNHSGQAPKALSQTLFIHVNYSDGKMGKKIHHNLQTFFCGVGAKVEIGHASLHHGSLSQWGIWLKGGASF